MIPLLYIALGCAAALAFAVVAWVLWGGDDPSTPEVQALLTMNGMWLPGGPRDEETDESMFGVEAAADIGAWPERLEWSPTSRHRA